MSVNAIDSVVDDIASFYKNAADEKCFWFMTKIDSVKKGYDCTFFKKDEAGEGVKALVKILGENDDKMLFGVLKVNTNDNAGSGRSKFVYIRYIGSSVGVMKKAKLSILGSQIDAFFTSKHITLDFDTSDAETILKPKEVTSRLLKVGGAHMPDEFILGPDDDDKYVSNSSGVKE